MRRFCSTVFPALLVAFLVSACSDSIATAPEVTEGEAAWTPVDEIAASCVEEGFCDLGEIKNPGGGGGDEACDPYEELDWSCEGDPCMESVGIISGPEAIGVQGCTGGGGGGDSGGSGGGSEGNSDDNDSFEYSHPPIELLSQSPPECEDEDAELDQREHEWCEGKYPHELEDGDAWGVIDHYADRVIARCPQLADDWQRSRPNLKVFEYNAAEHNFYGAAPRNGDWMLLSKQSLQGDPEGALAHELLHLDGYREEDSNFEWMVEQCSNGVLPT